MWSSHSLRRHGKQGRLFLNSEFFFHQSAGIETSAEQVNTSQVYCGPQRYRRHDDSSGGRSLARKELASSAPMLAKQCSFQSLRRTELLTSTSHSSVQKLGKLITLQFFPIHSIFTRATRQHQSHLVIFCLPSHDACHPFLSS